MFLLIPILILLTVYVGMNEKIEDSTKTGYFVVLGIFAALYLIFGILMS